MIDLIFPLLYRSAVYLPVRIYIYVKLCIRALFFYCYDVFRTRYGVFSSVTVSAGSRLSLPLYLCRFLRGIRDRALLRTHPAFPALWSPRTGTSSPFSVMPTHAMLRMFQTESTDFTTFPGSDDTVDRLTPDGINASSVKSCTAYFTVGASDTRNTFFFFRAGPIFRMPFVTASHRDLYPCRIFIVPGRKLALVVFHSFI